MKYTIEIQERYGKCKKYTKKIIEKDCFLAKALKENETKKDQERQKRGGGAY